MEDFNRIDAHAVHRAMIEAEHQAKERQDRMPSSANALAAHAEDLYAVREKDPRSTSRRWVRVLIERHIDLRGPVPRPSNRGPCAPHRLNEGHVGEHELKERDILHSENAGVHQDTEWDIDQHQNRQKHYKYERELVDECKKGQCWKNDWITRRDHP